MSQRPVPGVVLPPTDSGKQPLAEDDDEHSSREIWKIPDSWIPDPEAPGAAERNMLADYEQLDARYTEKGITPRFRLRSDAGVTTGFHAIARPNPIPKNKNYAEQEKVYMTMCNRSGKKVYKLFPLAEVDQRIADGWELWRCQESPLDAGGRDPRLCNPPRDVTTTDKPHLDCERYFDQTSIYFVRDRFAPPNWQIHEPLEENYKEEDNISTAEQFRPPNEWDQVVSGSSNGHFKTTRRPPGVGCGWGDYDRFAQWESYGRKVTLDMVEKKDWDTELTPLEFVSADDPSSTTTIDPPKDIKEAIEAKEGKKPIPLYDVLLKKGGG
ncbi:hypothetical protein F5Y10DRAFT_287244 [Nemania abortiva]|nr:hypothetical protein F5Y10DRAFT_287244 [Nemania abortiva]